MKQKIIEVSNYIFLIEIILLLVSLIIYGVIEFLSILGVSKPILISDLTFGATCLFFGLCVITLLFQQLKVQDWKKIEKVKKHIRLIQFFIVFFIVLFYISMVLSSVLNILNDHTRFKIPVNVLDFVSYVFWFSTSFTIFSAILLFIFKKRI